MLNASTAPSPVNRSDRSRGLPTILAGAWPPGRTSQDVLNGFPHERP